MRDPFEGIYGDAYIECVKHNQVFRANAGCMICDKFKMKEGLLPTVAAARKAIPIFTGVLDYFPDAVAAVAELSRVGNEQHNPGQPLHWDRTKSMDHADCIGRHMIERGTIDTDGIRHSAKVAWRALAMLQLEIEASK